MKDVEKQKERQRKWRQENKEKIRNYNKTYFKEKYNNSDYKIKESIRKKEYREKNINKILLKEKEKREKNRIFIRNNANKYSINRISLLKDSYIIDKIIRGTTLKPNIIKQYPELIEAKRLQILTKRLCRTSQN